MSATPPTVPRIVLVAASATAPPGLAELLADLGGGENGFGGTPVASGKATLAEYLQQCADMTDPARLRPGLVPQTVCWAVDAAGVAVGVVRIRHRLSARLLVHGGHIGYYVRRDRRRRGCGREILRLALLELSRLGERHVLVTTDPSNAASVRIIEANGGAPSQPGRNPQTGATCLRFWLDTGAHPGPRRVARAGQAQAHDCSPLP